MVGNQESNTSKNMQKKSHSVENCLKKLKAQIKAIEDAGDVTRRVKDA